MMSKQEHYSPYVGEKVHIYKNEDDVVPETGVVILLHKDKTFVELYGRAIELKPSMIAKFSEDAERRKEAIRKASQICNASGFDQKLLAKLYDAGVLHLMAGEDPAPAAVVPVGWKLVPVCPTDEMLNATNEHIWGRDTDQNDMLFAYQAMLAAAPKPEGGLLEAAE